MLHWKFEFVAIDLANATPKTAIRAAATHRPGCRTGTALISSAATGGVASSGVASYPPPSLDLGSSRPARLADRGVQGRLRDRALLGGPLREDRLVLAVRDQRLHLALHLRGERALLGDRDAVGRRPVRLAGELELAVRLL